MNEIDNIKYTKQYLIAKSATKVNDQYYRYHQGKKDFEPIDVIDTYDCCGFRLVISKTFPDSAYYCATEVATGIGIGGSCVNIDGLKRMLDKLLNSQAENYHNCLLNYKLNPRYGTK